MNKKGGFTLIELLAVIVILAIIAVIAVPIVIDIIDKSKENATLRSAEMYLDAVEISIANRTMNYGGIPNDAYEIMSNGNICLGEHHIPENPTDKEKCGVGSIDDKNNKDILVVEVKGEKPTSGTIIIENGQIVNELNIDKYLEAVKAKLETGGPYYIMEDGNVCIGILSNTACTGTKIEIEVDIAKPSIGTITITNGNITISGESKENTQLVISEKTIEPIEENGEVKFGIVGSNNGNGESTGPTLASCEFKEGTEKAIGAKYECDFGDGKRKFYILDLGTNPTNPNLKEDEVALILEGNYDTTTQAWCASESDNSCNADGLTGKLDKIASSWTELEREQIVLPSAEQIMVADGKSKDAYTGYTTISSDNAWLYNWPDNANYNGMQAPYGYWTSTPNAENSSYAWYVGYYGYVNGGSVGYGSTFGVRPVITLKI